MLTNMLKTSQSMILILGYSLFLMPTLKSLVHKDALVFVGASPLPVGGMALDGDFADILKKNAEAANQVDCPPHTRRQGSSCISDFGSHHPIIGNELNLPEPGQLPPLTFDEHANPKPKPSSSGGTSSGFDFSKNPLLNRFSQIGSKLGDIIAGRMEGEIDRLKNEGVQGTKSSRIDSTRDTHGKVSGFVQKSSSATGPDNKTTTQSSHHSMNSHCASHTESSVSSKETFVAGQPQPKKDYKADSVQGKSQPCGYEQYADMESSLGKRIDKLAKQ